MAKSKPKCAIEEYVRACEIALNVQQALPKPAITAKAEKVMHQALDGLVKNL